ncbi:DUF423 domain-containing protein [Flavobacterium gelidilacus]|jgi:uncharacterized membrane protein YgdD (TMEM256/DUF423 family)|uniref:DUF423 domain-containing protein n=1 Tax=Flavobacterium gelidilacus TaxID=206041 RepID=UPI00047B2A48|nr:DUF423 domain-containing protein [Flavobacterium gelidilacus]
MSQKIMLTALILGALAIVLGAFGAHGLKKFLVIDQLNSFEVGVRYQMYHALFLLFVAQANFITDKQKMIVFLLTLIGIVLFSGSIYLLATSTITNIKAKFIGPLTPIGGLLLISSWIYLFYCIIAKK